MKPRHKIRRFFRRLFGWMLRNPDKVADLVCWVAGCKVPAVVRELGNGRPVCRRHMERGKTYEPL